MHLEVEGWHDLAPVWEVSWNFWHTL